MYKAKKRGTYSEKYAWRQWKAICLRILTTIKEYKLPILYTFLTLEEWMENSFLLQLASTLIYVHHFNRNDLNDNQTLS